MCDVHGALALIKITRVVEQITIKFPIFNNIEQYKTGLKESVSVTAPAIPLVPAPQRLRDQIPSSYSYWERELICSSDFIIGDFGVSPDGRLGFILNIV